MRALRKLTLSLLTFALPYVASATSIVFVHYPGGYAIGADSKRLTDEDQPTFNGTGFSSETVCKLRTSGTFVLATYGGAGWGRATVKHQGRDVRVPDLREIGDQTLRMEAGDALAKSRALGMRLYDYTDFQQVLSKTPMPIAGWVFIDSTIAVPGMFRLTSGRASLAIPKNRPSEALAAGQEQANAYLRGSLGKRVPTKAEAIRAVREALGVATSSGGGTVGPPYSILTVDPAGVSWVERGPCK